MKQKEKNVSVMLRVPESLYHVLDKIMGKGKGGRSIRGGMSNWFIDLAYEKVGLERPKRRPDLSQIDLTKLDPKTRLIVSLWNTGLTIKQLVDELKDRGVPTTMGGQWREDNLSRALEKLAAKHAS